MRGHSMFENREISIASGRELSERTGKACGRKPDMYSMEKSDSGIVPKKEPNNAEALSAAEALEGRPLTKGNFCKDRLRLARRGRGKH
jgi:hypothetical protein